MKVLFKNRIDSFTSPGGDTTQMLQTKFHLENLGVDIDISLNPNEVNVSDYDLVHVYNLMRPLEATLAIKEAKKAGKPVVFSSIYWDFSEFNRIGRESNLHHYLNRLFSEFTVEKFKDLIRGRRGVVNKSSYLSYLFSDFKNTLSYVDLFLPNSTSEGELVRKNVISNADYSVVYNAVDKDIFYLKNLSTRDKKAVLAARIDPRKNILNLVKAVSNIQLDIFGNVAERHQNYFDQVKLNSSNNVQFKGFVESGQLSDIYNQYAVHIMPSWLETPGLSQLEAAACGCNIVSTDRGSAFEYFGDRAFYCDPGNIESIKQAVELCFENQVNPKEISEFILDTYIWENTAKQTLNAYERVLK